MAKPKRILYPVVFMILITGVYTIVLATINTLAAERIDTQEQLRLETAVLYTNNLLSSSKDIHQTFSESFTSLEDGDVKIYIRKNQNEIQSYTLPFKGKALWGTVDGLITFNSDFSQILGVDFLKHSETPGLGGRIEEDWFKEQFRGIELSTPPYLGYQNEQNGNIDAITGATLTSNAIKEMLNNFIEETKSKAQGGGFNE